MTASTGPLYYERLLLQWQEYLFAKEVRLYWMLHSYKGKARVMVKHSGGYAFCDLGLRYLYPNEEYRTRADVFELVDLRIRQLLAKSGMNIDTIRALELPEQEEA